MKRYIKSSKQVNVGSDCCYRDRSGHKYTIKSANDNDSGYWYFTRHGVQPGSVPRNILIDELIDKDGGSYFLANRFLTTDELREYEIEERSPFDTPFEADTEEIWIGEMIDELYAAASKFLVDSGVSEGLILKDFSIDPIYADGFIEVRITVHRLKEYLQDLVDVLDPIISKYDHAAYFNIEDSGVASAFLDFESDDVTSAVDVAAILTGIMKAAEIAKTVVDVVELVESLKQVGKEIYDKYKRIIDSGDYNPVDIAAQIVEDLQKISPEAIQ